MDPHLRSRRLVAPILRATAPGFACCHHCGWPWRYADQHCLSWEQSPNHTRGFNISCTFCYPQLTATDAVKYAVEVLYGVGVGWRWNQGWDDDYRRQDVLQCVCANWGIVGSRDVNAAVDQAWKAIRERHSWQ
jgi:hypothetical protein